VVVCDAPCGCPPGFAVTQWGLLPLSHWAANTGVTVATTIAAITNATDNTKSMRLISATSYSLGSRLHHWLLSPLRCPMFKTKFLASTLPLSTALFFPLYRNTHTCHVAYFLSYEARLPLFTELPRRGIFSETMRCRKEAGRGGPSKQLMDRR
jgi:hypothetical protein